MEYLTTSEIAEKWNILRRRVSLLCAKNCIKGAILKGNVWLIPENAEKSAILDGYGKWDW
ncbi:MAG: DNA-binding protein [Lachnospiraceae bacterium]|nr:DNA-binding protein [Lachnospiraceae bacterium]